MPEKNNAVIHYPSPQSEELLLQTSLLMILSPQGPPGMTKPDKAAAAVVSHFVLVFLYYL